MFVWNKDLELGIAKIDEQHMKLFDLGNLIYDLLKNEDDDNFDKILEIIDELRKYTVYHFRTEEELFVIYNYPDYEEHKSEHDAFIAYLDSLELSKIKNNQKAFVKELLTKIASWIFRHITTTDYLYKDFLIHLI